jgi:hypothetical protein
MRASEGHAVFGRGVCGAWNTDECVHDSGGR